MASNLASVIVKSLLETEWKGKYPIMQNAVSVCCH